MRETASELREDGVTVETVSCDVTSKADAEQQPSGQSIDSVGSTPS